MLATLRQIRGLLATILVVAASVLLAWFASSAALSRTASAQLPTDLSSLLQADYGEDEQQQVIPPLDGAIIEEIQQEKQRPATEIEPSTRSFAPIFRVDGGNLEAPLLPTADPPAQPPRSEPDGNQATSVPERTSMFDPIVSDTPGTTDAEPAVVGTPTPRPNNTGTLTTVPPTDTPRLTRTPRPTDTPRLTRTPRPTDTPRLTRTPRPTDTPRLTRTPRPTDTPRLTRTPRPTNTPRPPTSTPEPTHRPEPTQRSEPPNGPPNPPGGS